LVYLIFPLICFQLSLFFLTFFVIAKFIVGGSRVCIRGSKVCIRGPRVGSGRLNGKKQLRQVGLLDIPFDLFSTVSFLLDFLRDCQIFITFGPRLFWLPGQLKKGNQLHHVDLLDFPFLSFQNTAPPKPRVWDGGGDSIFDLLVIFRFRNVVHHFCYLNCCPR
jgi:hypothetical protein